MAAAQAFRVLTEFKFEVGSAIASTGNLQGAVDGLSQSADKLNFQLARIGVGFAASLGLVGGGALGLAGKLIGQFDMIEKQQIKIGGIFFANKGFLDGINTSNDALQQSSIFLKKISSDAEKFGLNERALAGLASLSTGITAKEGISPKKNIEFARNILKAGPQLGIDPQEAQGQIFRALGGGAGQGDPAFRAVTQETKVFQEFAKKIGGINKVTKEFNKLPTAERFELLNKAFGQFTQNSALLAAQANTVSSLILRIRQALFGFQGVLKPIGDVIAGPVKEALKGFLDFIKNDLKTVVGNFASTLKILIPDLETLIIRLQELSAVSRNFQKAGLFALIFTLLPLITAFKLFSKVSGGLVLFISKFFTGLGGLAGILSRLGGALTFVISSLKAFLKPLLVFFAIFQIMARAIAMARIADAKALPAIINGFLESFNRLAVAFDILFSPINRAIDAIADFISPIFRVTLLFETLVGVFKFVEKVVISALATISGALTVVVGLIDSLRRFEPSELADVERQKAIFQAGIDGFLEKIFKGAGQLPGEDVPVSGVTQHIQTVNVNQEFKEKFEPDRIAFTVVEQLKKIGQNATMAKGVTLSTVRAGN